VGDLGSFRAYRGMSARNIVEFGKAVGDAKLQSDGKADKVEGKVQNALGGLKDALKK
jgi:hypothetical protein